MLMGDPRLRRQRSVRSQVGDRRLAVPRVVRHVRFATAARVDIDVEITMGTERG